MANKDRKQRKKKRREERLRQAKHQRTVAHSSNGDLPYWMTTSFPDEEDAEDFELDPAENGGPEESSPLVIERRMRRLFHDMKNKHFISYNELQDLSKKYLNGEVDCDLSTLDDPKERAQDFAFRSMESGDPAEIERLAREALKLDPDCVDALVRLIPIEAGDDHDKHLELYRQAIEVGRRSLGGEEFFEEHAGEFWTLVQTRPFMRALFDYGNLNFAKENLAQARASFAEMVMLNPDDDQGARYPLLGCAFESNNINLARQTLKTFSDDESPVMRWGWVLERYLAQDLKNAKRALKRARSCNPYVERIMTGSMKMPEPTENTDPGSPDEAREILRYIGRSWVKQPEAFDWFMEQCQTPTQS